MTDQLRSTLDRSAAATVGATTGYDQATVLVNATLPGYVADLVTATRITTSTETVPEDGELTGGRTRAVWRCANFPALAFEPQSTTKVEGIILGNVVLTFEATPFPWIWYVTGGGYTSRALTSSVFRSALTAVFEVL